MQGVWPPGFFRWWYMSQLYPAFHILQTSSLQPPYGTCGESLLDLYDPRVPYSRSRCGQQCSARMAAAQCGCINAYMPGTAYYGDVIMCPMASQITSLVVAYSCLFSASLAFVWGNSAATGEIPAQKARNAENVSIWWHNHAETIATIQRNVHVVLCWITFK